MTAKQRAIQERLRELEDENGRLDVDVVIEAAKDPRDPMHSEFTWDVTKAAQERWRDQARAMIRSVRYTESVTQVELSVPKYVHVTTPMHKGGYMSLDRVKEEAELAKEVLNREIKHAQAALERARSVADVLECRDKLEQVILWIVDLQKQAA